MTVSRRLFLVALLCLLPSIAAGLFIQFDLHDRRSGELRELAMRHASLSGADIHSILDAARQVGIAASQLPVVQSPGSDCSPVLVELHQKLRRYAFLALYDTRGSQRCASIVGLSQAPDWLGDLTTGTTPQVGYVAREAALRSRFLPVSVPTMAANGRRVGTMVVALDMQWLDRHVDELRDSRPRQLLHSTLMIADTRGTVIATDAEPGADEPGGPTTLEAAFAQLMLATKPGFANVPGPGGSEMLVAHIPPNVNSEPVMVAVSISLSSAAADIDGVALRAAVMAGSSSIIALVLALAAGEAFIRRPTERLVAAARRWRVGDFAARAPTPERTRWVRREDRSEFGRLAAAFNEMADALQERQAERERASQILEARVAERTRALSESNNRLQVEITERQKTEAALAQAQKLQAVGRLAGGIAHDFNNLLATILGNLELIERRIDRSQERLHGMIQRAVGAVTRGSQLTARLLAFSRRHRPTMAPTDVNKLITDLLTLAASTLGRGIKVETRLDPNLWPAMIDHNQVEAALLNLALNARDAMPEGGTLTFVTINEALTAARDGVGPGDFIRIEVADTGVGMSEDVLRQAFEPFFTTKGPAGSGLGLSQVYGVASQIGGGVRIKSVPGAGTTVALLLPRAMADSGTTDTGQRITTQGRLRNPPRVLLIDDDRAVCQATMEMLRELGCEVLDAQSGEEGLDILQRERGRFGIILVDYAMPGLNGLDVAARARRQGFDQPILMITGYAELGDPSADGSTMEPDARLISATLRKPFSLRDLEATLARLLSVPANV